MPEDEVFETEYKPKPKPKRVSKKVRESLMRKIDELDRQIFFLSGNKRWSTVRKLLDELTLDIENLCYE